ncbi:MAG: GNAT family N-acetyltransferase [Thiotrichales bacterium]
MNISLRQARESDFERLLDYVRAWLICLGQRPIGYVVLDFGYTIEFGGRDAFIDELFLEEARRGFGYGRAALEVLVSEAAALGIKALHLEVAHSNEPARRLYRTLGFDDRTRFSLMSKRLSPSDYDGVDATAEDESRSRQGGLETR